MNDRCKVTPMILYERDDRLFWDYLTKLFPEKSPPFSRKPLLPPEIVSNNDVSNTFVVEEANEVTTNKSCTASYKKHSGWLQKQMRYEVR